MLEMTMIDSEADLQRTINHEILPVALNETHIPRLVVFTAQKTWKFRLIRSTA